MDPHEKQKKLLDFEERFANKLSLEEYHTSIEFFDVFTMLFTDRHFCIFIELLEMAIEVKAVHVVFSHLDDYVSAFGRQRTLADCEAGTEADPSYQRLGSILDTLCFKEPLQQNAILCAAE